MKLRSTVPYIVIRSVCVDDEESDNFIEQWLETPHCISALVDEHHETNVVVELKFYITCDPFELQDVCRSLFNIEKGEKFWTYNIVNEACMSFQHGASQEREYIKLTT